MSWEYNLKMNIQLRWGWYNRAIKKSAVLEFNVKLNKKFSWSINIVNIDQSNKREKILEKISSVRATPVNLAAHIIFDNLESSHQSIRLKFGLIFCASPFPSENPENSFPTPAALYPATSTFFPCGKTL